MKKQQVARADVDWKENRLKWLVVALLLVLAIVFNDYLRHISFSLCLLVWCTVLAVCGWLFLSTVLGQQFRQFLILACQEMVQVEWPNRDEVVRTTMMVAAMVFVVSFMLWLIDLILVRTLGFFVG